MDTTRLTIVSEELEAEMLCQLLREDGIHCGHRRTDVAAGAWQIFPTVGGPREVFVRETDLEAAQDVLRRWNTSSADDSEEGGGSEPGSRG
jgi:Putative prokaryotic signal transducing protein